MDKCKLFLETYEKFSWFIIRWFNQETLDKCIEYAKASKENELLSLLEKIWFDLPDHIFNIIENPKGWTEFLRVIEY